MKKKISFIFLVFLGFLLPLISLAQFDDLKVQLQGKKTFSEITSTVEQYLATTPDSYEKSKFEKHYNRWAYYQSLHLGPNGEFVNISKRTFEAVAEKAIIESPNLSYNGSWTLVGPNSSTTGNPDADLNGLGRVDRMAFHPTNASIIYVGTPAGGLWKTTNGGTSWSAISSFIPSLGISGIVVDHSDPNTLYVLTGDGDSYDPDWLVTSSGYRQNSVGVLVSHDGGTTWEQTSQMSSMVGWLGYRLVQHPTNSNILIAATSDGIYRTTNGGGTWIQEREGKHFDIEFKPGDPTRVYASAKGSFVYSTNTGDSWITSATFNYSLCDDKRIEIAVTPHNANKVFLLAGPAQANNKFCGFYVSSNSGLNFDRLSNNPNVFGKEDGDGDQSEYDMGLAVSPSDDDLIIAAGLIIYKSTNGGSTFSNATFYRESGGEYIHPDIHSVEYNPLNGYLYAAGDGGFHRSVNNGDDWTDLYDGIATSQFYHLDDYDANQYTMLAGAQDNGLKYKVSNTTNFLHIFCCDGFEVAINYNDQSKGYGVINGGLLKFTHFTGTVPITINGAGWFKQIELHSSDPTILYYSNSRIWEYDADLNTHTLLGGADISGWWALKTCPSNSSRIYAAGGTELFGETGEMFMSTDNGSTWSTISDNPGFPASFPRISDIGVKPTNSQAVYVCFSGYRDNVKVYYSNNAGTTWTNVSYDLPNIPVWSIEVDSYNNVYIGTDYGVFYKAFGATNWEPYYNGLPNVPISDLAINEGEDQLLASTYGRGIWISTLREPCPPNRTIAVDLQGQDFRSASNSITMSGDIVGGEGTSVALRAGNYVDLTPGFIADGESGNKFLAYVGDCEGGMPPDFSFGNPADTNNVVDDFSFSVARNLGTLEIRDVSKFEKKIIIRLFNTQTAKIKVFMADKNGTFIKDIAQFEGAKGEFNYTFNIEGLTSGMHYLYLGVNKDVNHLQELFIP